MGAQRHHSHLVEPQGSHRLSRSAPHRSAILHYQFQPPARPFVALAPVFGAWELEQPGEGVDLKLDVEQASATELRAVLRRHGVKHTDLTRAAALRARVRQLTEHGLLGLPRAGRADVGGPCRPVRNTARDVALYFERSFGPWFVEHGDDSLAERTLVWDNASTHSAVAVDNTRQISLFHRLFREWGWRGCFFLPPRSPSFQPVELCFAFIRHWGDRNHQ